MVVHIVSVMDGTQPRQFIKFCLQCMAQNHTINNFNTQVVPLQLDGYRFCIVIFFMCKGKVSYLFKPHY